MVDHAEPLRLRIKARDKLKKDSDLLIDQIRAIDNKRLIEGPLTECSKVFLTRVYEAVSEVMGIEMDYDAD